MQNPTPEPPDSTVPSADRQAPAAGAPNQGWLSPIRQLVPLVDNLSAGLRKISLFGLLLGGWLFVWAYLIQQFSLGWALTLAVISLIPVLIIARLWWAVRSIQRLPELAQETVAEVADDLGDEVREVVADLRQNPLQAPQKALGIVGQIRNLWQMRRLLGDVDDWLAHGLNIGSVLNPLSLLLGVVALVALGGLTLLGAVLALFAIF